MTPSSPEKVDVIERTDAYAVVAWRRLMLLVWRGPATAAGVERSRALFQPWVARQVGGGALLIVIPGRQSRPPDAETRAAMERTASDPEGPFKGMGTLIEAEGFVAATVRSVMTRLRRASAATVFRSSEEAAAWAAQLLGDPELTPAGLSQAIAAARTWS